MSEQKRFGVALGPGADFSDIYIVFDRRDMIAVGKFRNPKTAVQMHDRLNEAAAKIEYAVSRS